MGCVATSFPGNLDTFTARKVVDLEDAVKALEAKVGKDGSAVTSSHDYKLANLPPAVRLDPTIPASGEFLSPAVTGINNYALPLEFCGFIPLLIPVAMSIDALGIYIPGAGGAGSVVRLGIYSEDPATGKPANVLAQVTLDGTVSARAYATFTAVPLNPGWHWLAAVNQVAAATLVTTNSGAAYQKLMAGVPPYAATEPANAWGISGISGALANNPSVVRATEGGWACVRRA